MPPCRRRCQFKNIITLNVRCLLGVSILLSGYGRTEMLAAQRRNNIQLSRHDWMQKALLVKEHYLHRELDISDTFPYSINTAIWKSFNRQLLLDILTILSLVTLTECGGRKNSTSYSVIEETKQRVLFPRLLISDFSFYRVSQYKDFNWRYVSFQNDKNTAVEKNVTITSDKCVYELRAVCKILAFTNKDVCDRLYKKERTVT